MLREERDWSQEHLGSLVEMNGSQISKRESGKTHVPFNEQKLFAKAFGITLEEFEKHWRALVGGGAGGRRLASGKPRRYIGLVEKAGLPVYAKPMHTLRRNCGTEWAEQGIPLADLAKWMGNSVAVAAEYYVRTTPITFARVTGLTNEQANARPTATGNRRKSGNSNALGR